MICYNISHVGVERPSNINVGQPARLGNLLPEITEVQRLIKDT
jgi:hypothetical protein